MTGPILDRGAGKPDRQGVVLLLVLALVVLVGSVAVLVLTTTHQARDALEEERRSVATETIRGDVQTWIGHWLDRQGSTMVTDPDHPWDPTILLDDRIELDPGECRVACLLWDARSGEPVLRTHPEEPRLSSLPSGERLPLLVRQRRGDVPLFPELDLALGPVRSSFHADPPAELVRTALWSDGQVNVLTASRTLLMDLARTAKSEDTLTQVLDQRQKGVDIAPLELAVDEQTRLVTGTNRWQALLVIRLDGRERRWWILFQRADTGARAAIIHEISSSD